MNDKSLCMRIPKRLGERIRQLLIQLSLLDGGQKITGRESFIDIPLSRSPDVGEWKLIREIAPEARTETSEPNHIEKTHHPRNVVEILRDRVDATMLSYAARSFDLIGDIAVIEVPPEFDSLKRPLAEAIIEVHRGVKTVLCKKGAVDGKFRVRAYEHILGEARTVTTHRENGCRYTLDVTKVYFSPRLATEHLRVASQVSTNETVVDMFAGIGGFSILIAKKKRVSVLSVDANPDAVEYMKMNCSLNKVEQLVKPFLGDARQVILKNIRGVASRVIMNLPSESLEFLDAACLALKPGGGIVHSYQFQSAPNPIGKAVEALRARTESLGRTLRETLSGRLVRSTAPREWQVVVDAIIE